MRHVRRASEDRVRADVDDPSVAVLSHHLRACPTHQVKPVEIDAHDAPPFLESEIVPFDEWHYGRRIHLNIEFAGFLGNLLVQNRDVLGIADIAGYGEGFPAA